MTTHLETHYNTDRLELNNNTGKDEDVLRVKNQINDLFREALEEKLGSEPCQGYCASDANQVLRWDFHKTLLFYAISVTQKTMMKRWIPIF